AQKSIKILTSTVFGVQILKINNRNSCMNHNENTNRTLPKNLYLGMWVLKNENQDTSCIGTDSQC
ncbi:hypothetical protein, partial [Microcystis aeruginosa]|uniref:hypothetical protein n=1 Tax=Microcystis aeruginosa TaxID=1126 RepID=UPI001C402720